MTRLLALFSLLLLGASYPVTLHFGGMPPPRFRGSAEAKVLFTDRAGIDRECGVPPSKWTRVGCRRGSRLTPPNPCSIYQPNDFETTLCHEIGHVNGWPADHGS